MNIADAAKTVLTLLGEAEDAVTHGPDLIALVTKSVKEAEDTSAAGQDKLTDVLNKAEVFLNDVIPKAMDALSAILKAIEDFVNALVALYNEVGAFIHGIEHTLGVE